ncbi:MAG TPA: hypothetical protein VFP90_15295 [Gemmatimonadaceae bacterium]|nr:hypothetical protein [Gemmatimonadaceae bacterium]
MKVARSILAIAAVLATAWMVVPRASRLAGETPRLASTLPASLSDQEFWRLSSSLSEANGFFQSENLVSNEHTFQYVVPALTQRIKPGGVYLGVAPDQNFTYMLATQPAMAFIVDIRRGNLLEHLLYKALIELSADRADFLSRLFSKKRPAGLGAKSTAVELFAAFDEVRTSEELYHQNVAAVNDLLVRKHGFTLSPEDLEQLESIYFAFFWDGPDLRYSSMSGGGGGMRGFGAGRFPSYEELMMQTDWNGVNRTYLSTEERFRWLKTFETKNLIVPVVGNFAGTKALRSVGKYIRDHGGVVTAFYVSNVEQYLFQDSLWDAFARNVATLPVDASSVFIRSVSTRFGYAGSQLGPDQRASALDPILQFDRDFAAGRIRSYYDVNARSR